MTTTNRIEQINARYEAVAEKLVALGFTRLRRRAGDIFRLRRNGLQVQLTRPIGTFDWGVREVGTMRRIEWPELRAASA